MQGAARLPKTSVTFRSCLRTMVFVDNLHQREVVENVRGTSRAFWASWKRGAMKRALVWNQASHTILSFHLGMKSLAGWWKMSFWIAYSRLRVCVIVQKGVPSITASSCLSHGKPHRGSGVLGWFLKMRRRKVRSECEIEEKRKKCKQCH